MNTNKWLLQLLKTTAPCLRPISVKRKIAVTALVAVANMRPMPGQTKSKRNILPSHATPARLGNSTDTHQEDEKSFGLLDESDLDDTCMVTNTINEP